MNLLGADAASFSLSSGGAVWVRSVRRAAILAQRESDERFTEEALQSSVRASSMGRGAFESVWEIGEIIALMREPTRAAWRPSDHCQGSGP